ncbi:hypothetical protein LKM2_3491 [Leptospira kirschneri serovar Mozdok]|nr:hypothetical protein [Leptospira kirschneri serovar Mozdok]
MTDSSTAFANLPLGTIKGVIIPGNTGLDLIGTKNNSGGKIESNGMIEFSSIPDKSSKGSKGPPSN